MTNSRSSQRSTPSPSLPAPTVIIAAYRSLRKLGIERPRVAVCGLSPHAGEGGLFGREEIEEIQPAMRDGAAAGIAVQGRLPADTVFSMMVGGPFDLVVAMDHDQGHIPTKLTGFRYDEKAGSWLRVCGVNVTLGLPIVRTSVDHGTAFGKAGLGRANPQSMIQTIEMAVRLTGGTAD